MRSDTGTGIVYIVGAGPGDPGLLTVRAAELLRRADVVVHDALVGARVLNRVPAGAERIDVGKRCGGRSAAQREINCLLIAAAARAEVVVRLKGGDPFVFGRGGEEALALRAAGVRFEVVPGVTAATAVAAYAGIPLTHRTLSSAVTLVTGHEDPGKPGPSVAWSQVARAGGTIVVYMGMRRLAELTDRLIREGCRPDTPAAVIEWGTYPHQRTVAAPLAELAARSAARGLGAPALVVVGQVAGLHERLEWFERRPLHGRRIVVARSRVQPSALAARLEALGAEAIEFPRLASRPAENSTALRRAVRLAAAYDWTLFTSVATVDAFWRELRTAGLDARALAGTRLACAGAATAAALERRRLRPDLATRTFDPDAVVSGLGRETGVRGTRVLFPRDAGIGSRIARRLADLGAAVEEVPAVRTVVDAGGRAELTRRLDAGEIDAVAFASSGSVERFAAALGTGAGRAALAAIGPATARAARAHGFAVDVVAAEQTIDGLVRALVERVGGGE